MRSILVGSLFLVVLGVVVQPDAANKVGIAGGIVTGALKRLSNPSYGGVPNYAAGKRPPLAAAPIVTTGTGGGGGSIPRKDF